MAVDVKVEVEKRDSPATLINECLVKAALKHARLMPQMPALIGLHNATEKVTRHQKWCFKELQTILNIKH